MRFLFVGGGTGGHLTPAIGLAEGLEARGHETLFLLSGRAVERNYLGKGRRSASLDFEQTRLPRPLALLKAAWRARRHAARFHPDAVIALGGAASAASLGVPAAPLVLLEGNHVVGKSVKWMAGFSVTTLTMFEETAAHLRRADAIGPVTRQDLGAIPAAEARRSLGLDPECPTLLVMGGSQGAADLNSLAARLLPDLAAKGWQVLALCGSGKGAELEAAARAGEPVVVLEHCAAMGMAYSASDFALTRGGASTIGELWLAGLPAAIAPYPWHKDRQQEHNARALDPGFLVLPDDLVGQEGPVLEHLLDVHKRQEMASVLRGRRPPDGQAAGVQRLEEIAGGKA